MSNMISAWLAGYVGVMARRKIISAKKQDHRMYWEVCENITEEPDRMWSIMTCPQSWWRTTPSPTTLRLSFKMKRKKIWGKGALRQIYFLLLHHPRNPEAKTLLLLESRKTMLGNQADFQTKSQRGQHWGSTGWAGEGDQTYKPLNSDSIRQLKYCHYKLEPFWVLEKGFRFKKQ